MQIREYQESDLVAVRSIHAAQGFDYALPDLRNPLFVTKLVLTGEDGERVAFCRIASPRRIISLRAASAAHQLQPVLSRPKQLTKTVPLRFQRVPRV